MTEPNAAALADELEREANFFDSNASIGDLYFPHSLMDAVCRAIEALRAKSPASPGEGGAVAWIYDLAMGKDVGGYYNWKRRVTEHHPEVPVESIRNVRPLFAAPLQAEQLIPNGWENSLQTWYYHSLQCRGFLKITYSDLGLCFRCTACDASKGIDPTMPEQPAEARTERGEPIQAHSKSEYRRMTAQGAHVEWHSADWHEGHAAGFAEAAATVQKMLDDLAGVDDYAAPHYRFILRIAVNELQPKEGGR